MNAGINIVVACLIGLVSNTVVATDFIKPYPTYREEAHFPMSMRRKARDGWVMLSFVVDKEGKVSEPVVIDSSGERAYEKSAMDAIVDWKFKPGRLDGKAMEVSNLTKRLSFTVTGDSRGVRRSFLTSYNEFIQLMQKGEFDAARDALEDMGDNGRKNMYEDAYFWVAKELYAGATGDNDSRLKYLRRAIGYHDQFLSDQLNIVTLVKLFFAEIEAGYYHRALWVADRVKRSEGGDQQRAVYEYEESVREWLHSKPVINTAGEIDGRGTWYVQVARPQLALTIDSGQVESAELRCERWRTQLPLNGEKNWDTQPDWGPCLLLLQGKPGSRVMLEQRQNGN